MKFGFHALGVLGEGSIIEILLEYASHVRIMDEENYNAHKKKETYKGIVQYVTETPYIVKLPRTANWYIVVDLKGRETRANLAVRVHQTGKIPKRVVSKLPIYTPPTTEAAMEVKKAEELTKLSLDATPICCQIWDRQLNMVDCNEAAVNLFGYARKKDFINGWARDCLPEYQPDGQRSSAKILMAVKQAFTVNIKPFELMQYLLDGTTIPTEVTLVRVLNNDERAIAWYTKDMRDISDMKNKIQQLRTEADKIYYDPLTGIYNRRYLDENLSRLIKSMPTTGGMLSLMMIDIDCFKQYNDTYGHGAGDNCLKIVADVLTKSNVKPDDFTVRYGGEEFTVVLPDTDEEGACYVAERMLVNIKNAKIPHEKNTAADYVTFSIGIVTAKVKFSHSREDYINKADEMLYTAKQGGRYRYAHQNF